MRFPIAVALLAGTWTAATLHVGLRAQDAAAKSSRSVMEGVFTEDQAKRGAAIYDKECASCHGQTLEGLDMAPPLSGGAFMSNWNTLSVGDLFERIRLTMPDGNPGSLSRQQDADVVAYILKSAKYPFGKTELPTQTEALKQIKLEPPKP